MHPLQAHCTAVCNSQRSQAGLLQNCSLQVLDKAFMSGVLVMTAFWATAVAKVPASHTPLSHKPAKASDRGSRSGAQHTATASRSAARAAGQWSVVTAKVPPSSNSSIAEQQQNSVTADRPSATAAAAVKSMASAGGPGSSGESTAQASSSSLVGVEVVSSLSYLQFCRMRLTAYNALLKAVLPSISASSQVTQYSALLAVSAASLVHGQWTVSVIWMLHNYLSWQT